MNVSAVEACDGVPAALVSVAVAVWLVLESAVVGVMLHVPLAATVVVPAVAPSMSRVSVSEAWPVPEMVGVAVLTVVPLAGAVITGTGGTVVSTVNVSAVEGDEVLPALVSVAVAVWLALESTVVGVRLHVPLAATVVVPALAPSMSRVSVSEAWPVPEMVGVAVATVVPLAGAVITGGGGKFVLTVNVSAVEACDGVPAALVSVAVAVWLALESAAVGVRLHVPLVATVVVPAVTPSMSTVSLSEAWPVPEIVGVAVVIVVPLAGAVMDGGGGTVVSTVNVSAVDGDEVTPALVSVAVAVWLALESAAVGVRLHVPLVETVVVPAVTPSMSTVSVSLAWPVPEIVGVAVATVVPLAGAVMDGGGVMDAELKVTSTQ